MTPAHTHTDAHEPTSTKRLQYPQSPGAHKPHLALHILTGMTGNSFNVFFRGNLLSFKSSRAQRSVTQPQIQEMSCAASFDAWKIKGQRPSDPLIIMR